MHGENSYASELRLLNRVECNTKATNYFCMHSYDIKGRENRCFITDYGATETVRLSDFEESALLKCNHLHIGGLFSCKHMKCGLAELLAKLKKKRMQTLQFLDTNYDASEKWGWADGVNTLDSVLNLIDVLLINESEACGIANSGSDVDLAIEIFSAKYPTTLVVVTLGSKGCCASHGGTKYKCGPQKADPFLDATELEMLNAGFLFHWRSHMKDIATSLQWGCRGGHIQLHFNWCMRATHSSGKTEIYIIEKLR